jgi:hypothetical protein
VSTWRAVRCYAVLHSITQAGLVDDVRTFNTRCDQVRQIITDVRDALKTEEGELVLRNIRALRRKFEPEVMAERDAEDARRAKAAARFYRRLGVDMKKVQKRHLPRPWAEAT